MREWQAESEEVFPYKAREKSINVRCIIVIGFKEVMKRTTRVFVIRSAAFDGRHWGQVCENGKRRVKVVFPYRRARRA